MITIVQSPSGAVSKESIGLGNVDNTPDSEKPVSTAQQAALDAKQDAAANLGAFAAIVGVADKGVYFTAPGTIELFDLSAAGRGFLALTTANAQRAALGLGSMALQPAEGVDITGGTIQGITPLAVADGGTGGNDAASGREGLELGDSATRDVGTTAGTVAAGDDARLADSQALLASHFKPSSENLFISISEDGVNWREQLASYTPLIAGVRDPSMIFWDGAYYLAHTVNAFSPPETRFALAKSVDGINWSHLRYVDLSGITGGPEFVWAPELRILENRVICLVSVSVDSGSTFQTYLIDDWGRDLATNGEPQLIAGLAANTIDATVIKEGDTFFLFYKNEAVGEKVIEAATAENIEGPYTIERSGNWAGWGTNVEGQNIVRLPNGKFRIYIDAIGNVKYSDSATEDLLGSWSSPVSISGIACQHPAMIPKPESYVPDVGLGVRTGNFTARIGGRYIARGNLTVTDPTGTSAGQEYAVVVGSGTCTIGGVGFSPSRFPILRQYNGSSWETIAQTLVGNLTLPSATFGTNNALTGATADAMYRKLDGVLGFSFNHRGNGFALTTNGTMGTSTSYSTGLGDYRSAAGSNVGDFTTDIGNFNIGGGGDAVTFYRNRNHIFSWNVGASANNSATSIIFMVGGNATSLSGKDPIARSFGVTITDAVTAGQTQYILWTHDGTSLVGSSTVSLASPRLWANGGRMSLVYQWNGGTPTLRLFLAMQGQAPVLITSLSGAAANWGGDITLGSNRNFVVRHYVNTAGVVNFWFMSDLRWISEPTTIP